MPLASFARIRLAIVLAALSLARHAGAQAPAPLVPPDSLHVQVLELRDGSSVVGRVVSAEADTIRFATAYGMLALPRSAIRDVKRVAIAQNAEHGGEYWPADPNLSRLFLGPTGRTLEEGDGYFSDTYLLLLGFHHGFSNRLTMGGGFSIIPSGDIKNNIAYVAPKLAIVRRPQLNVAVGAYAGIAPFLEHAKPLTGGLLYGAATVGPPEMSLTVGTGYGFANGALARRPVAMLGFHDRFSKRVAFVTENYLLPGSQPAVISYGLRFFGEKMAVDLAFWNVPEAEIIYPGIPYVAFASHF